MKSDIEYKPLKDSKSTSEKTFDINKKNPKIKEQGGFVNWDERKMTDLWATILFLPTMLIFAYLGLDGYFNGNTI